jgi:hypothetical protein
VLVLRQALLHLLVLLPLMVRLQRPFPVRVGSRSVLVLRQALLHLLVLLLQLVRLQRQLNQQRCVFLFFFYIFVLLLPVQSFFLMYISIELCFFFACDL